MLEVAHIIPTTVLSGMFPSGRCIVEIPVLKIVDKNCQDVFTYKLKIVTMSGKCLNAG